MYYLKNDRSALRLRLYYNWAPSAFLGNLDTNPSIILCKTPLWAEVSYSVWTLKAFFIINGYGSFQVEYLQQIYQDS